MDVRAINYISYSNSQGFYLPGAFPFLIIAYTTYINTPYFPFLRLYKLHVGDASACIDQPSLFTISLLKLPFRLIHPLSYWVHLFRNVTRRIEPSRVWRHFVCIPYMPISSILLLGVYNISDIGSTTILEGDLTSS
ncbi:hypothetical protein GGR51DRAFT_437024 [Nemania sp. FL0031]|nr:hypothetical protein GGR51DRAFT_437024 [Nemania sp. FL0031]